MLREANLLIRRFCSYFFNESAWFFMNGQYLNSPILCRCGVRTKSNVIKILFRANYMLSGSKQASTTPRIYDGNIWKINTLFALMNLHLSTDCLILYNLCVTECSSRDVLSVSVQNTPLLLVGEDNVLLIFGHGWLKIFQKSILLNKYYHLAIC